MIIQSPSIDDNINLMIMMSTWTNICLLSSIVIFVLAQIELKYQYKFIKTEQSMKSKFKKKMKNIFSFFIIDHFFFCFCWYSFNIIDNTMNNENIIQHPPQRYTFIVKILNNLIVWANHWQIQKKNNGHFCLFCCNPQDLEFKVSFTCISIIFLQPHVKHDGDQRSKKLRLAMLVCHPTFTLSQ